MQVSSCAPARIAAQPYHFTCFYDLSRIDQEPGQVTVISFQAVGMPYYQKISVAASVPAGFPYTYHTVKGRSYGIPGREGNIRTPVLPCPPERITASYLVGKGTTESTQRICQDQCRLGGKVFQRHIFERMNGRGFPSLVQHVMVKNRFPQVKIFPRMIFKQYDPCEFVPGRQCVQCTGCLNINRLSG